MPSDIVAFDIISHRCNGFGHPENSLLAFESAMASAVDLIEVDVRLTKDLRWVVMHNPFLSEKRRVLRVHEHNYSSLKREVTLLDTMLARFARSKRAAGKTLMIDVKDVGGERALLAMLRKHRLTTRVIVIAWEPEILRRVHASAPKIRIGLSYVPIHSTMTFLRGAMDRPLSQHNVIMRFNSDQHFNKRLSKGVVHQHYLSYIPDLPLHTIQVPARLCTEKLIVLAHRRGIKVYPFIVDSSRSAKSLRGIGVDGVMTDRPEDSATDETTKKGMKQEIKKKIRSIRMLNRLSSSWSS